MRNPAGKRWYPRLERGDLSGSAEMGLRTVVIGLLLVIGLAGWCGGTGRVHRAINDPLGMEKSRVFEIHGVYAVRGTRVHNASLRQMITTGVNQLAQTEDAAAAWRCFISDDDIVALNFTRVGDRELGVNTGLAEALLDCLYEAGFRRENIMVVGLDVLPDNAAGTRPWRYGWQAEPTIFNSDEDFLATWLDEVTAIINVPSILDDNIIGMRGGLANLCWPVLKRPARLYVNHGDPFMAEVFALPEIQSKLRLTITNALRILYQGGPVVQQRYVYERGTLIFSADPVAADSVALEILLQARESMVMPDEVDGEIQAGYLNTAEAMGLGYANMNQIQYRYIRQERW
ncbi:MAG: DUF362 domain-containing protein [Sedimentisphaerales bacterium]|nr:DUF362 domain-containing protein [Sedimentisphaerales bacterium]